MRTRSRKGVVSGLGRCPFCHDDVHVEAGAWVACQQCLARHHTGCWAEGGRCAACGAARALDRRAGPRSAVIALLLGLVAGVGLARAPYERLTREAPSAPVARVEAKPAASEETPYAPAWVWERLAFLGNEGRFDDAEAVIADVLRRYPSARPLEAEMRQVVEGAAVHRERLRHHATRQGRTCIKIACEFCPEH